MIVLDKGDYAGVRWNTYFTPEVRESGIAFWVRGHHKTLRSDCYASCVGLVLSGDVEGCGAVVHFWDPSGLEEAKVSFQLLVQVRNKLLDAYQDILRMQV